MLFARVPTRKRSQGVVHARVLDPLREGLGAVIGRLPALDVGVRS
jgi:hypothetical protein